MILKRVNKATVITNTQAQVILPLGQLVQRGFLVKWDASGFEMKYPCGKVAEVELELGCPTVSMEVAEELISILEIGELGEVEETTGNAEWWKKKLPFNTDSDDWWG